MKKALRVIKKIALILLIIILTIAFIGGVIWALDFTGVINFYKTASKLPVVGKMIPKPEGTKPKKTPLQLENEKLREGNKALQDNFAKQTAELQKKMQDAEHQLSVAEEKNKRLETEKKALKGTVDSLQLWKESQQGEDLNYKSLAKYYATMKPDKAVKIMENLDNDVVAGILLNLDEETAASMLSAMDPKKAADVMKQMKQ